jgi:hypothetical protein
MAKIVPFTTTEKTAHNSHKFGFTLSPNNYGFWKTMLQPFLVTNSLFGYVDGTVPCPEQFIAAHTSSKDKETDTTLPGVILNPDYTTWVCNDAHVRMLLLSTISEASFQQVQGTQTSRDVWLALERAYAPHTSSREYTLKTQLLRIEMKGDETSSAYLNRAQEYADALANIGESMKEKDVIMLVVSGLREEYNNFKSTFFTRPPTQFSELYSLLADHDYMMKKYTTEVSSAQAFTASSATPSTPAAKIVPADQLVALQQMLSQLGIQVPSQYGSSSQAFYANRGGFRGGRGQNRNSSRGRGSSNNRNQNGGNRNPQFSWASNQNTVYGSCNRCGIGHIPSQCPNRDPSTFRKPPTP